MTTNATHYQKRTIIGNQLDLSAGRMSSGIRLAINAVLVTGLLVPVAMLRPTGRLSRKWQHASSRRPILVAAGTLHRSLYQWSGGRVGGNLRGRRVLLLTTTGRKTGQKRTWPLCYFTAGDTVVLVAAAAGEPRHPAWYRNLVANPRVDIQMGESRRTMIARPAEETERTHLWDRILHQFPMCAAYQRRTSRKIPVVLLQPPTAGQAL